MKRTRQPMKTGTFVHAPLVPPNLFTVNIKRKHQLYCYELSRVLGLEYVYIDYYYFNRTLYGSDPDKKRRILEASIMKRNIVASRQLELYRRQYTERMRQTS